MYVMAMYQQTKAGVHIIDMFYNAHTVVPQEDIKGEGAHEVMKHSLLVNFYYVLLIEITV